MKISPFSGTGQFLRLSGSEQLSSIDRSGQIQQGTTGPQQSSNGEESSRRNQSGDTSNNRTRGNGNRPPAGPQQNESPGNGRRNQPPSLPNGEPPVGLIGQRGSGNQSGVGPRQNQSSQRQSNGSGSNPPATNIPDSYQNTSGRGTSTNGSTANQSAGEQKGPNELTPAERKQVQKLKRIDAKVRAHEQAHLAAAGPYAQGGPSYEYTTGPDGKRYAVGGSVSLDTSKADSPEKTIKKMQRVRQAALAPANPSSQDMSVANQATQKLNEARAKKQEQEQKERSGESSGQSGENGGVEGQDNSNQQPSSTGESGQSDSAPGESGTGEDNNSSDPFVIDENDEAGRSEGEDGESDRFSGEEEDRSSGNETEFFDDFGEVSPDSESAGLIESAREEAGESATEGSGEREDDSFSAEPTQLDGADSDDSPFENELIPEDEEEEDGLFTADATRRESESTPGQVFDLVI